MTVITERPIRPHIAVELFSNWSSPFTLDYSTLDVGVLGDEDSTPIWTDWTDHVINITTHRGGAQEGLSIKNEVGLLTVTLRGIGFDIVRPDFYAGQQIRLFYVNGSTRHPLFTGQIRDLDKQNVLINNNLTPVVQLVAVDAVADHNAITRYGAMPPSGSETFVQRIARLTSSARTAIAQPTGPYNGIKLGRTVYESTLANHLTLACNTARAMWWVDADNITRFQERRYDPANAITFIGYTQYREPEPEDLHIIRENVIAGTRVMFNAITKHVLGAKPDEDDPSNWVADERDVRGAFGIGSITTYGRREVVLTTNDADFMPDDDTEWLTPYDDLAGVISSMTWNAQEDLTRIPDLDIGASIWAPRSGTGGEDSPPGPSYIIIGVHHTITPTRWMVELTLIGA